MRREILKHLIDEFGQSTLIDAHRLHTEDGEGANAVSAYTGIPMHSVSACIRAGGVLAAIRAEQRTFEDAIVEMY